MSINPIENIDWSQLRDQKETLINVMKTQSGITLDRLHGILHLINSIQDYAVDELGIPEEEVLDNEWNSQNLIRLRNEVEYQLLNIFNSIAMDKPSNFDQIVEFVCEDITEVTSPQGWGGSDVTIGLRRWMEVQTTYQD